MASSSPESDDLKARLDYTRGRRDAIVRRRRSLLYFGFALSLLGVFELLLLILFPTHFSLFSVETYQEAFITVAALGPVCFAGAWLNDPGPRERDLKELQDEIDLRRMTDATLEQKAHKLLSIQQSQLSRYFDVILQQSRAIFIVGIFAMLVGVGVVVWAIWQTRAAEGDWIQKALVAALGAVGAILTNYVAAIYLKMFGDIGQAVQRSVGAMTQSSQLNFANVVIANIEKQEVRDEARKQLVATFKGTLTG